MLKGRKRLCRVYRFGKPKLVVAPVNAGKNTPPNGQGTKAARRQRPGDNEGDGALASPFVFAEGNCPLFLPKVTARWPVNPAPLVSLAY
jgi:hypothetical protein